MARPIREREREKGGGGGQTISGGTFFALPIFLSLTGDVNGPEFVQHRDIVMFTLLKAETWAIKKVKNKRRAKKI